MPRVKRVPGEDWESAVLDEAMGQRIDYDDTNHPEYNSADWKWVRGEEVTDEDHERDAKRQEAEG